MRKNMIAMVNVGAHGHINPTLPVVRALSESNAEVHYFAPENFRDAIEREGGIVEAYDSVFGKNAPPAGMAMNEAMAILPAKITGECLSVLPTLERRLSELQPNLVIYDKFCLAARLVTQKLGLKAATFLPSYAANEHFNLGKVIGGKFGAPPKDHPAMIQFQEDLRTLKERFGFTAKGVQDLFSFIEPLNICFVAKQFQYECESFDNRFVFVGPCIEQRADQGSMAIKKDPRQPLLFISLGTVFNAWPEFFKMCFEAFGGSQWHVLMAVGKNTDQRSLGPIPENFELAEYLPQLEILERADVFVTHGGMNSTMESLWFGVPMVVIPQMGEQAATAMRVEELGLGQSFFREDITAEKLRHAVEALRNDAETKARVQNMQASVRQSGGKKEAVKVILQACLSFLLIVFFASCKTAGPDSAKMLDKGMNSKGQAVFVWPTDRNHRNYDRLAELMDQYSELTGNCLNRPAEGSGEAAFKSELESRRRAVRQAFVSGGITKGCTVFRENFIDQNYVGSAFAQYGYCNESSYTALCLATQAGFKNTEILKCETMHYSNDHTFSMVERPGQKWCMMDRYDLIGKGHFFCNASWNEPTKLIFVGSSAARHRWYEGILCKNLDLWLASLK